MIPYSILQLRSVILCELHAADSRMVSDRLKELEIEAAGYQVVSLQHLSQCIPSMFELIDWLCAAERQRVVNVRLLGVVVGAYLVHPELNGLPLGVPVRVLISRCEGQQRQQQRRPRRHFSAGPVQPQSPCMTSRINDSTPSTSSRK
eukprot:229006-Pleurochrysis_carterae.AAC.2